MNDVGSALLRIEMDARAWVKEFEAALERIAQRGDRSNVVVRPMKPTERDYRTHGVIYEERRRRSKK